MPKIVASYNREGCANDRDNWHVVSENMTERISPFLSSKTDHAQNNSFASISEVSMPSHEDASKGTERDVAVVVAKLQLLSILTKESLEKIYRRTTKSASLAMANYHCVRLLVWIGTMAGTSALSLLIFLRKRRLSARMLRMWIFVKLMLPLKSLMDSRHQKLSCKINSVSLAAATCTSSTDQTSRNLRNCNNFSSDLGAPFVTSSLSPYPKAPLQRRLHESKRSPIQPVSAPSSISLSSTKESSRPVQKLRKKSKNRSDKITRNYIYPSDAKINSRSGSITQNPSAQSEKPTAFDIKFPNSSVLLNSKQQTSINIQSKLQRIETNLTITKSSQTTSKATAPNLSTKSGAAVIVWSISLLLVLSALSLGRLPAILFTSLAWIAIFLTRAYTEKGRNKIFLESFSQTETIGQKMSKCSTSATTDLVDFTSNNYKKKIIMDGFLERNRRSVFTFSRSTRGFQKIA